MKVIQTNQLTTHQKERVTALWNAEYPASLSYNSIAGFDEFLDKIEQLKHYILSDNGQNIVGWLLVFIRDEEIWFSVILDSNYQKVGLGKQLLNLAKQDFKTLNGWVIDNASSKKSDGSLYPVPLPFYLKNGFNVLNDVRLETEKLSAVKIRWKLSGE
ncbi:GNAT family N-acetyltransferase [uncultured Roseivirga sp.]|uniref:GNAT family N-acetyltransferase n=1 Tax=uncultured Roseivirga sp. TaxID=543088 RepID=UPI0030D8A9AE|tara:strand:+ start:2462 stop:2935 length:474 start_codon:yes stop_codon:yes gene_type:complete